jgi:hypothetical protein
MELKDLVGPHELSGVDMAREVITTYGDEKEEVDVVLFILDGITYKAVEDPSDGYRSYCRDVVVCEDKVSNTFPPQQVIASMKEDEGYSNNDTIQFTDVVTGKVVLQVGTDNHDDYYPYCVMVWNPENLAINNK